METFRRKIQQTTGWSDAIVNAIQSEEEARVYIRAELKEAIVNGKPALIQPRIDPNYQMPEWWIKEHGEKWRGWTNSDLMGEGYPPHDENGDPYDAPHRAADRFASCRTDLGTTPGRGKLCGAAYD